MKDLYTNDGMFKPGVDPEVTCWHCGSTHLCDCMDATCWKCNAPYAKERCKEFGFEPKYQPIERGEKQCNSVSAGLSLLVRESSEIVRLLLTKMGKVVLSALNAVLHMLGMWKSNWNQKKGTAMTINEFAKKVTLKEGGKKSISIAQVKEVLKIVNDLTGGALYAIIKLMK